MSIDPSVAIVVVVLVRLPHFNFMYEFPRYPNGSIPLLMFEVVISYCCQCCPRDHDDIDQRYSYR